MPIKEVAYSNHPFVHNVVLVNEKGINICENEDKIITTFYYWNVVGKAGVKELENGHNQYCCIAFDYCDFDVPSEDKIEERTILFDDLETAERVANVINEYLQDYKKHKKYYISIHNRIEVCFADE